MESIKIVANQPKEKINKVVLSYPFNTKIEFENESVANTESLIFNIDREKVDENLIYDSLVNFILHLINKLYMKDIINKEVSIILKDFIDSDIEDVENTVYELLIDEDYFIDDKKIIYNEIREYISNNNILIIEGYLRFRTMSFENLLII